MKVMLLVALLFAGISFNGFAGSKEIYEEIKSSEALSKLIIRDMDDRIYSGQIKSHKGFTDFINKYLKAEPLDFKINFENLFEQRKLDICNVLRRMSSDWRKRSRNWAGFGWCERSRS